MIVYNQCMSKKYPDYRNYKHLKNNEKIRRYINWHKARSNTTLVEECISLSDEQDNCVDEYSEIKIKE